MRRHASCRDSEMAGRRRLLSDLPPELLRRQRRWHRRHPRHHSEARLSERARRECRMAEPLLRLAFPGCRLRRGGLLQGGSPLRDQRRPGAPVRAGAAPRHPDLPGSGSGTHLGPARLVPGLLSASAQPLLRPLHLDPVGLGSGRPPAPIHQRVLRPRRRLCHQLLLLPAGAQLRLRAAGSGMPVAAADRRAWPPGGASRAQEDHGFLAAEGGRRLSGRHGLFAGQERSRDIRRPSSCGRRSAAGSIAGTRRRR